MSIQPTQTFQRPTLVKEMEGTGSDYDIKQRYSNLNNIGSIEQISEDHWETQSLSGQKTPECTEEIYHFDNNNEAKKILNYMA